MKIQRRSRFQPSSQGPGSSQARSRLSRFQSRVPAKQSRSRFQPSCQGPGSSQAVKVPVPAKQSVEVPVPAKQSRSRFQPSCQGPGSSQAVQGPGSSQAVKVPVPAKQSRSRFQPSSSRSRFQPSSSRSRFQSSSQVPGSTTSPIPSIRLRNISSSFRIQDESDPIDPTHQSSSSQGQVPVQFQSRSSSCQVPGSTTSPIPSIRLRNISSSSRIQDESDPIDPTHQSSSSQGQVPVQFQSRSSSCPVPVKVKFLSSSRIHDESDPIDPTQKHKFQFPDPRRVRSHRSDSPVQFLSRFRSCQGQGPVPVPIPGSKSVPDSAIRVRSHRSDSVLLFSLRFQVPDRTEINCFSWWFDSGIRIHQCGVHDNKFRSEVRAGSS